MHRSINKQRSKLIFTVSAALLLICCFLYSCKYQPNRPPAEPINPNIMIENFSRSAEGGDPRGAFTPNTPFRFVAFPRTAITPKGDSTFSIGVSNMNGQRFGRGILTLKGENSTKGTYQSQDFRYGGNLMNPTMPLVADYLLAWFYVYVRDSTHKPGDTIQGMPLIDGSVRIPAVPKQAAGTWEVRSNLLIFDGDTANAVPFTANSKALFFVAIFPDSLYQRAGYDVRGNTVLSLAFRRTN
jgi:hypothetical protein